MTETNEGVLKPLELKNDSTQQPTPSNLELQYAVVVAEDLANKLTSEDAVEDAPHLTKMGRALHDAKVSTQHGRAIDKLVLAAQDLARKLEEVTGVDEINNDIVGDNPAGYLKRQSTAASYTIPNALNKGDGFFGSPWKKMLLLFHRSLQDSDKEQIIKEAIELQFLFNKKMLMCRDWLIFLGAKNPSISMKFARAALSAMIALNSSRKFMTAVRHSLEIRMRVGMDLEKIGPDTRLLNEQSSYLMSVGISKNDKKNFFGRFKSKEALEDRDFQLALVVYEQLKYRLETLEQKHPNISGFTLTLQRDGRWAKVFMPREAFYLTPVQTVDLIYKKFSEMREKPGNQDVSQFSDAAQSSNSVYDRALELTPEQIAHVQSKLHYSQAAEYMKDPLIQALFGHLDPDPDPDVGRGAHFIIELSSQKKDVHGQLLSGPRNSDEAMANKLNLTGGPLAFRSISAHFIQHMINVIHLKQSHREKNGAPLLREIMGKERKTSEKKPAWEMSPVAGFMQKWLKVGEPPNERQLVQKTEIERQMQLKPVVLNPENGQDTVYEALPIEPEMYQSVDVSSEIVIKIYEAVKVIQDRIDISPIFDQDAKHKKLSLNDLMQMNFHLAGLLTMINVVEPKNTTMIDVAPSMFPKEVIALWNDKANRDAHADPILAAVLQCLGLYLQEKKDSQGTGKPGTEGGLSSNMVHASLAFQHELVELLNKTIGASIVGKQYIDAMDGSNGMSSSLLSNKIDAVDENTPIITGFYSAETNAIAQKNATDEECIGALGWSSNSERQSFLVTQRSSPDSQWNQIKEALKEYGDMIRLIPEKQDKLIDAYERYIYSEDRTQVSVIKEIVGDIVPLKNFVDAQVHRGKEQQLLKIVTNLLEFLAFLAKHLPSGSGEKKPVFDELGNVIPYYTNLKREQ